MDRGVAMMVTEVLLDGGGLRSFRRRRTAAAAAGWMETVEMKDVIGDGSKRWREKKSDVWHIWWIGGRNTTCWHH